MKLGPTIPILRIFDEAAAEAFYLGFLGFHREWEHRFEAGLPLYQQVSRSGCVLHLSGHHGDGSPGIAVRIAAPELDALQAELIAKRYTHARPGIESKPWGAREMTVLDPFGNRLVFTQPRVESTKTDQPALSSKSA